MSGLDANCSGRDGGESVESVHSISGELKPDIHLDSSILLIVDGQKEYVRGPLALPSIAESTRVISRILRRARELGTYVIHVAQAGRSGGLFDPDSVGFEFIDELTPLAGESVVHKRLPNAFTGTHLEELVTKNRGGRLIVAGFMTHNCVASTLQGALDRGIPSAVLVDGVATRPLPNPCGGSVSADVVNAAVLAGLTDRITWPVSSEHL
jgi:nicotinamidase-related amidase